MVGGDTFCGFGVFVIFLKGTLLGEAKLAWGGGCWLFSTSSVLLYVELWMAQLLLYLLRKKNRIW